jgi:hypothetical protein
MPHAPKMPPTLNTITSTAITKIRIRPTFFTISPLFYVPLFVSGGMLARAQQDIPAHLNVLDFHQFWRVGRCCLQAARIPRR